MRISGDWRGSTPFPVTRLPVPFPALPRELSLGSSDAPGYARMCPDADGVDA